MGQQLLEVEPVLRFKPIATSLNEVWGRSLTGGVGIDPYDTAIQELSAYFHLPSEEVRQRCLSWEDDSMLEWNAADRSTPEGLLNFYQTQISWIFDTVWYHAQQYHGEMPAESVAVAEAVCHWTPGRHLDFGAGPGSSSLFFHRLGWKVALADISTTMLDFARWRLARHGVSADFYDPATDALPSSTFDLVTAFDVMVHVPDIPETLDKLWQAMAPGGLLVFNIDNRERSERTEWHLYEEQYPILREMRRAGFRRCPKIDFFHVYEKTERSPAQALLGSGIDRLRYNSVVTSAGKIARRVNATLSALRD